MRKGEDMKKKRKQDHLSPEKDVADMNEKLKCAPAPAAAPTGYCWCGCGEEANNFFVQTHDGKALRYLNELGHKGEKIADRVLRAGFDPIDYPLKKEWERWK